MFLLMFEGALIVAIFVVMVKAILKGFSWMFEKLTGKNNKE